MNTKSFTTSSTWVVPEGIKYITVNCRSGAGGGGGSGGSDYTHSKTYSNSTGGTGYFYIQWNESGKAFDIIEENRFETEWV